MAEYDLTQREADALIALPKVRDDDEFRVYPNFTSSLSVPLVSQNGRENFHLDMSRGRLNLSKRKWQNRARTTLILVRLEVNGPPHRNPDGVEVPCPHIHIYKEGYGDKWAFPVSRSDFVNLGDPVQTLEDFFKYCNIIDPPLFGGGF